MWFDEVVFLFAVIFEVDRELNIKYLFLLNYCDKLKDAKGGNLSLSYPKIKVISLLPI